jgi:hypothetical protein
LLVEGESKEGCDAKDVIGTWMMPGKEVVMTKAGHMYVFQYGSDGSFV